MADKNLTAAQKAKIASDGKAKLLATKAAPSQGLTAGNQGRTSAAAAHGITALTSNSIGTPSSQRLSPGNKPTTTMTTTTTGAGGNNEETGVSAASAVTRKASHDVQHSHHTTTAPSTGPGGRRYSAERTDWPRSPPKVSIGIGKDFWAPIHKPWCKKKAFLKYWKFKLF
jgi:hypothetical protein